MTLTVKKLADLQTFFYMGRDRTPSEYYEKQLQGALKELRVGDLALAINHLIEKSNFQTALAVAAKRLGRLHLASRLQ
jgi:hypothetical protein